MALGNGAYAGSVNSIALGNEADADGTSATAFGALSRAHGSNSIAAGVESSALGDGGTAFGGFAEANAANATAIGYEAVASAINSTSIGTGATAGFAGSTAIGAGATSSAANEITLGGSGSSIRIGDLAASTAAQSGPVDVVTVDANGTLGRQAAAPASAVENMRVAMNALAMVSEAQFDALSANVAALDGRLTATEFRLEELDGRSRGGIAAAMAMGGMMVVPDSNVSVNASVSTFQGEQGFSGGITARLAERVYVSAAIAGSTAEDTTGGRVGVALGF